MTDVDIDRLLLQVEELVAQAPSDLEWAHLTVVTCGGDSWHVRREGEWIEDDENAEPLLIRRAWKRGTMRRELVRTVQYLERAGSDYY